MTENAETPKKETSWLEKATQLKNIFFEPAPKQAEGKKPEPKKETGWTETADWVLGKYDKVKEVISGPPAYKSPFSPTIDRLIPDDYERPVVEKYRAARDDAKYYWDKTWNTGRDAINKLKEFTGYGNKPETPDHKTDTSFVPEAAKPAIVLDKITLPEINLSTNKGVPPTGIQSAKQAALTIMA